MTIPALLVAAAIASSGGFARAQEVLRHQAFEITMPPGIPLPTATKTGDASGVDYSSETRTGVYRIQYMDLPQAPAAAQLFDSIRKNIKAGMHIESEETFTLQGYPGLRMFIEMPTLNQVMRMDCIVVGARLYRVWYISRTMADVRTPAVRAFFDSFQIKAG